MLESTRAGRNLPDPGTPVAWAGRATGRATGLASGLAICAAICAATCALTLTAAPAARRERAEQRLAQAAARFLAALDAEQATRARFPFDAPARRDWHYVARARPGLELGQLDAAQRGVLHDLLHTALSSQGYLQVSGVVHLESLLRELESRPDRPATARDPGRYAIAVFGEPGREPWAWRFEGHHVSVHFTAAGDATAHTPFFLGASPARVPSGPEAGWRLLAEEEDLGRELYLALPEEQRARARLAGDVPGDVILGPGRDAGFERAEGLAHAEMQPAQRALLEQLLAQIVDDLEPELAAREWARLRANDLGRIRFAWSGGTGAGEPHYWRLHGPHFAVEFDNVQGGANHAHLVWRDLERDFGGDLLRRHRAEHHAEHQPDDVPAPRDGR